MPDGVAEDADLIVLNTCHIREKAAEKVYSELGRIRELKERGRGRQGTIVTVAGCVAQAEGAEIAAPRAGGRHGGRAAELSQAGRTGRARRRRTARIVETDFPRWTSSTRLPDARRAEGASGFLTVQEGCDKFCTFCVVPYTRGAEFSRTGGRCRGRGAPAGRARRARADAARPERQRLSRRRPGGRPWSLAQLIDRLADIEGIERMRYTTSHPRDMGDDLIEAHRRQQS